MNAISQRPGLRAVGLIAAYDDAAALRAAVQRLGAAGIAFDTFTPRELRFADDPPSRLPLLIALAGFGGAALGFLMQAYAADISYPINVGGRPLFSWPSFIPIAFEIGALCAVIAGFVGYLIAARLPTLYAPIDEAARFAEASASAYVVAVRTDDGAAVRRVLHDAVFITELPDLA